MIKKNYEHCIFLQIHGLPFVIPVHLCVNGGSSNATWFCKKWSHSLHLTSVGVVSTMSAIDNSEAVIGNKHVQLTTEVSSQ